MKNLFSLLSLSAMALGFSSCCIFSGQSAEYRTETRQVKTCYYDTVTEQIMPTEKGGMVQTIEKKVPRYKTVTKKVRVASAGPCTRYYCAGKGPCGSTSQKTIKMASTQGSSGSPNLGLIPTMKPLAP